MKKILITLICLFLITPVSYASFRDFSFGFGRFQNDTQKIKSLLNSQVRYANRTNFDKFISTYDKDYTNSDGFDLTTYSSLVKDIWESYDNIKYDIEIKDIAISNDSAVVKVLESSRADIPVSHMMDGVLNSEANSLYRLKKSDGTWKVVSDEVIEESTTMLYGDAKNLDIKLSAPLTISAGQEYTASLEFEPPEDVIAIASISMDKVEYPQKQPIEVYRKFPESNLLERLFTSNKDNLDEYVVASIGLTKADFDDENIKLSLTGFGYKIIRVNVVPKTSEKTNDKE